MNTNEESNSKGLSMLGIAKNIKYNNKVIWETRELHFYKGTFVDILDIHIGYSRIANIFNIVVNDIQANFRFGEELDASFISDFRHNELDQIVFDIEEFELILYPNKINKEVSIVKDYIILLAQCRQANFEEYQIL